ncbi:unnamed protein product [Sphagnum troendelagicum]
MQFPMRFLRGSGVHGAKLLFQDLGFYFNLSLYKTTIQAYLNFFQDHVSRKGKPSAKAHKDSDPQRAGKGTWEVISAEFRSSSSKLLNEHEFANDGDDVIGDKDAAKQLETDSSENISKADRDKDAENSIKENVYGVSWFQEDRIQGTWL